MTTTTYMYDHHHIGDLEFFDFSATLRAEFRGTPEVFDPVRILHPLVVTGGVATYSGKEYTEPRR